MCRGRLTLLLMIYEPRNVVIELQQKKKEEE